MFKRLRERNFHSHKDSELEFSSGFNVIYGNSQAGKTSLLRGLQLLATNRPLGFRFNSNFSGGDATEIELETVDGTVRFIKTEKEASYYLDSKRFSGFGSDVPDQIKALLDLSELNIQNQLDQHFLVTSSPGEVARRLNGVARLEKVDEWLKSLTSRVNSSNREVALLRSQVEEIAIKLEEYNNLGKLERKIRIAEDVNDTVVLLRSDREGIVRLREELNGVIARRQQLRAWIDATDILLVEAEAIEGSLASVTAEFELVERYIEVRESVRDLAYLGDCEPLLKEAEAVWNDKETLDKEFEDLSFLSDKGANQESRRRQLESDIEWSRSEYKKRMEELGVCPTCFGDIDSETLGRIMENL